MTLNDIPDIIQLDKKHFKGNRAYLLKRRFSLHPDLCYVLVKKGKVNGFIMGIPKENHILIGPWIVHPREFRPYLLLQGLVSKLNLRKFRMGILEDNKRAVQLAQNYNFIQYSFSMRMIYGKPFSHSEGLFAIAGPDRG